MRSVRSVLIAALLASCSGEARIDLIFEFEDGPPTFSQDVFYRIRIEERIGSATEGRILAQSELALFSLDAPAEISDIPNGQDRVAIVELLQTSSPQSQILYYGVSQRFELKEGRKENIEVPIPMRATPTAGELAIKTDTPGFVQQTDVTLLLTTDSATLVRISDQADFPDAQTETRNLDANATGALQTHELSWKLDRYSPCDDPEFCERSVYVRFVDAQGYSAPVLSTRVVIDQVAPTLLQQTVELSLTPAPGSLRDGISTLGPGAIARLSFTTSEPLVTTPTVTANGPQRIGWTRVSGQATSFVYELMIEPPGASVFEGAYTLEVSMRDPAGHESVESAELSEGPLEIDTSSPPSPSVHARGAITFERRPWGNNATGPRAQYILQGSAGSVAPGALIAVYDDADVATANLLDRFFADSSGAFSGTLTSQLDRQTVFLQSVDAAGNTSDDDPMLEGLQAAEVRRIVWTASFALLTPDQPHQVQTIPSVAPTLTQRGVQVDDLSALSSIDGASISVSSNPPWRSHPTWRGLPEGFTLGHAASAYDTARNRLVLYGLRDAESELWSFDGKRWTQLIPEGPNLPPRQLLSAMAYDATRDRIVLFGGRATDLSYPQETWEFGAGRWTQRHPSSSPIGLGLYGMAYDPLRGKTVLFGGTNGTSMTGSTWEWDSDQWSNVKRWNEGPRQRTAPMMAFDPSLGGIVMFGGCSFARHSLCTGFLNDTWLYNGEWTELQVTRPPARRGGVLTYDNASGRMLLFGGSDDNGSFHDLWALQNGDWTLISSEGPSRTYAGGGYDALEDRLVIGGGCELPLPPNNDCRKYDTWYFDGSAWLRADTSTAGPGMEDVIIRLEAVAYDEGRNRGVAYGLRNQLPPSPDAQSELFEWDGIRWHHIATASAPPARMTPGFAYDPVGGGVLLIGGNPIDTPWRWDGSAWTELSPLPSPQPAPAVATDLAGQRIMLFGGTTLGGQGTLWSFDNAGWTALQTSAAPSSDTTNLLGVTSAGQTVLNQTRAPNLGLWAWDGAWSSLGAPPEALRIDGSDAFFFDPGRGLLLSLGDGQAFGFDGASTIDLTAPGASFSPRSSTAGFYDRARARPTVVTSGGGALRFDTFSMPPDRPDRRPGIHVVVDVSETSEKTLLSAIEINATLGGEGRRAVDNMTIAGGRLSIWNAQQGRWAPLTSNDASSASPNHVGIRMDADLDQYVLWADRQIHLMFEPGGVLGSGPEEPEVTLDHIELKMEYKRSAAFYALDPVDFDRARALEIDGPPAQGVLDTPKERNVFRFEAAADAWLSIDVNANPNSDPTGPDTVLVFYDEDRAYVGFADDAVRPVATLDSRIQLKVPEDGVYYLMLAEFSTLTGQAPRFSSDWSYTLSVTTVTSATETLNLDEELGDDAASAVSLEAQRLEDGALFARVLGDLEDPSDVDFFRFEVPAPSSQPVFVAASAQSNWASTATPLLRIMSPDGAQIHAGGPNIVVPPLESGTYLLSVSASGPPGEHPAYVIDVIVRDTLEYEREIFDAGGTPGSALSLTPQLDSPHSSFAERALGIAPNLPSGDVDYFSVEAQAGDRISFSCTTFGSGARLSISEISGPTGLIITPRSYVHVARVSGTHHIRLENRSPPNPGVDDDWVRCVLLLQP